MANEEFDKLLEYFPLTLGQQNDDEGSVSISERTSVASVIEDYQGNALIERFDSCCSDVSDSPAGEEEQRLVVGDDGKLKTYRMHLATVPGDMAGKVALDVSQSTHIKVMGFVEKFLKCLKIRYQVLDRSSFSYTALWGVELYGCFFITCTRTMVRGMCALFGMAFRQDAVGIFTDLASDDDKTHDVFLVSRLDFSLMNMEEALQICGLVQPCFPKLSAQRDETGGHMEFHNYCNEEPSISKDKVLELLHDSSRKPFPYDVEKYTAKSALICQDEYTEAIQDAGLESYELMILMCQLHSASYPRG